MFYSKVQSIIALAAIVAVAYFTSSAKATDFQRVRSCTHNQQQLLLPINSYGNQFAPVIVEQPRYQQFLSIQRTHTPAPAVLRIEQPRHRSFRAIEVSPVVQPVRQPVIEIRNRGIFNRRQLISIR